MFVIGLLVRYFYLKRGDMCKGMHSRVKGKKTHTHIDMFRTLTVCSSGNS